MQSGISHAISGYSGGGHDCCCCGHKKSCCDDDRNMGILPLLALLAGLALAGGMITIMIGGRRKRRKRREVDKANFFGDRILDVVHAGGFQIEGGEGNLLFPGRFFLTSHPSELRRSLDEKMRREEG